MLSHKVLNKILYMISLISFIILMRYFIDLKYLKTPDSFRFINLNLIDNTYNETPNVNIFNLNKPLEPTDLYEKIICKKSVLYIVQTTLCIHDVRMFRIFFYKFCLKI